MAELEIHHETEGERDPFGQRIGILTSILAVMLAIVTIVSHRAHTKAVLEKAEANDQWAYYQAKRIKLHNVELGIDLVSILAPDNATTAKRLEGFEKQRKKYTKESDEVQSDAKKLDDNVKVVETRALRYDFGEGLLEISLVLSSLYFLSKKKLFPTVGFIAGVAGIAVFLSGYTV